MRPEFLQMAADLAHREESFVLAVVVHRRPASSSQTGDMALITARTLLRRAPLEGGNMAPRSEIFAFNTTLVRLTSWLKAGQIELTLHRLASQVPDWSDGTKIGECLADFVAYYLDELVNGQTIVLILSDGLDRGDVQPLAGAMRAIRARARKVLWLNPLAGDDRYQPTARAMAAALPYVDRLLPAHNLESLERLLLLLAA